MDLNNNNSSDSTLKNSQDSPNVEESPNEIKEILIGDYLKSIRIEWVVHGARTFFLDCLVT